MDNYLIVLCLVYVFYVSFESLASLARFGGFEVGYMSVGVSLQNQILSANRLLGFMIAPMIGFYADTGGTSEEIFWIGLVGGLVSGVALIVVYLNWSGLSQVFARITCSLVRHGYGIRAFWLSLRDPYSRTVRIRGKIKKKFLFAQLFTTGLAMPSVFLLNIIAIKIPGYSSTLLQMATVISGVGNLVLNFYTMPLLAVEESKKGAEEIEDTHKSIFIGKIIGMLIFSPIILCSHYLI